MEKGHYGQYTGNARCCKKTKVTSSNYRASERDDAAHISYLKRDIDYDNKHGHSDENMTADEKHISKLAGDMKYDKEHHGSPAKTTASSGRSGHPRHMQAGADNSGNPNAASSDEYWRKHQQLRHHQSAPTKMNGSPAKHDSPSGRSHIHTKYHTSYEGDATFPEDKNKGKKVVSGTHTSDSNKSQIIDKKTGKRLPKRKN